MVATSTSRQSIRDPDGLDKRTDRHEQEPPCKSRGVIASTVSLSSQKTDFDFRVGDDVKMEANMSRYQTAWMTSSTNMEDVTKATKTVDTRSPEAKEWELKIKISIRNAQMEPQTVAMEL